MTWLTVCALSVAASALQHACTCWGLSALNFTLPMCVQMRRTLSSYVECVRMDLLRLTVSSHDLRYCSTVCFPLDASRPSESCPSALLRAACASFFVLYRPIVGRLPSAVVI